MTTTCARPCLVLLLLVVGWHARAADEADFDEQTLREAKIGTDGPGLLAFLRERTLTEEDGKRIETLVEQLGHKSFRVREKASAALVRAGRPALGALRRGAESSDVERATRSRRCLELITAGSGTDLPVAALRLVARRRPVGAASVVLGYLPFADDPHVEEEAFAALVAVAVRDGKVDAAITRALSDKSLKRAAAARALGAARDASVRAPVRKMLADRVPRVRFEAARALLFAREKASVPVLIDLLRGGGRDGAATTAEMEIAGLAESLLFLAAGDKSPEASAGDGSPEARKKWHESWVAWWKTHGERLDLSRITAEEQKLGLVLVAETSGGSRVWEYGRDRKERWKITGFGWPMDVRVLPGGNVLVADSSGNGVTEYDKSGKRVWQKASTQGGALAAQRLPNGNTFICEHQKLYEVDRSGKEVAGHTPGGDTITDALRLPKGNVVFMNVRGLFTEITWPGCRTVRTLRLSNAPPQGTDWYRMERGVGGHFLLASHTDGRVFEIDGGGKVVWEHTIPQAYSATRLANGNVLIATAESRRLIEVDRAKKVVHEVTGKSYMGRVRAR